MFKIKCDMRQKPKNLVFIAEDVETAIEFLSNTQPTQPLELIPELCAYARQDKTNLITSISQSPEKIKASQSPDKDLSPNIDSHSMLETTGTTGPINSEFFGESGS